MSTETNGSSPRQTWRIAYVEDNADMLRQVTEFLAGSEFSFGSVQIFGTADFDQALGLLRDCRLDLVILDIYRGDVQAGDAAGRSVLERWQAGGFTPVIIYTALPEALGDVKNHFVRIVPKAAGSLQQLGEALEDVFRTRVPQIHRAVMEHLDRVLADYMWGFVTGHWDELEGLSAQPDFIRLLLVRLSLSFTRDVAPVVRSVYPTSNAVDPESDNVHPVAYYVKPPIGTNPRLGDLRYIRLHNAEQLMVVVWPSCDLVLRSGRYKVEQALCAKTVALSELGEHAKWLDSDAPSRSATRALEDVVRNQRTGVQADRYHFLPAAWDIPATVVDFGQLENVPVAALAESRCLATLASPFAESMSARMVRYLGRLGTPDLDLNLVLESLRRDRSGGPGKES